MPLPIPNVQIKPAPEPATLVRSVGREDVTWGRPKFKAPPLNLHPQPFDPAMFAAEFPRTEMGRR